MSVEFKVVHTDESAAYLRGKLPALRELPDDAAVAALQHLYRLGFEYGAEAAGSVAKETTELLGRLVVATRAGDGAKVFDLIHEFAASRCVVREEGSPTH